jgi:hypothetical protein
LVSFFRKGDRQRMWWRERKREKRQKGDRAEEKADGRNCI